MKTSWLVRHKNPLLLLMLFGTLLVASRVLPRESTPLPVSLALTDVSDTLSPIESYRLTRDSEFRADLASLQTLAATESLEKRTREEAAQQAANLIALHQAQLALEGALADSSLAPCAAVLTEKALTLVTSKEEITQEDTALVLSLAQLHTTVSAENIRVMTSQ